MKRLFTFLALCCLVVTGAWAQLADGIYTIKCPNAEGSYTNRGTLAYKPGNDQLVFLAEVGGLSTDKTNATGKTCAEANVCGYWGIKNYNGHTWIYNLGNGKTINKPTNNNGASSWADIAADNYVSIESSTAKTGQFWIKGNYTSTAYLSASAWWAADQNTGGVRWYNSPTDAGDNFSITAVESTLSASLQTQYATTIAAAEAAIKSTMLRPTYVNSSDTRATSNGEHANKLVDDSGTSTKWGMSYSTGDKPWIVVQADNTILKGYDLYNGNDTNSQPGRRWKNWTVEGSNDNTNWTTIATVTNANMNSTNYGKNSYSTESNDQQYNYYRFTITANEGGSMIQMSDLQLKVIVNPITYTISADGKPDCVTVTIEGNEITGTWAQGIEYTASKSLTNTDIVVTTDDGYVATYTVDNNNHQINFDFNQIFVPIAHNGDPATATKYLIKNGDNYYLKYDNGNLPGTQTRSEADKYVFVKHATKKGKYYVYSVGAEKYLTYTSTGNGSSTKTQTSSKVQLVANQADAKCWTFDNQICITPEDGGNAGLNFMGGADAGYVMNLYLNSDRNSKWQIIDGSLGSLACAVTMFSKPGAEYMHKLIPEEGVTVTGLELLDGLTGLELKTDRQSKGNGYAYVHGTAPSKGVYHYNVLLSDDTKARVTLTVSDFLQAPTPGMVWVSWNWFESKISAQKMTAIADGLVAKGLVDAGYKTIVLDDAWGTGTKNGNTWVPSSLTNDTNKFPDMASFVQTINGKGIRVGLYSDASNATCGGYQPGSIGVEAAHVAMFEGWGIDFLKYDFCGGSNAPQSYKTMGDAIAALNATREAAGNRVPFVFNACEWGQNSPHLWGAESGTSMWRATSDARESWLGTEGRPGVLAGSDRVRTLWMYAGVNRFNDLDMMCIGLHGLGGPSNNTSTHQSNGGNIIGLTEEQARSQMSIWSMLASPLSLSCDVRETPAFEGNTNPGVSMPSPLVTESDLAILKNADIISISQDPLGQQAEYMASLGTANTKYQATGIDVYVKDMAEGKMALAVVNRNASGTATSQTISLNNIYLDGSKTYYVRDVWATSNKNFTVTDGQIVTGELAASQTKVYIISEEPFEEDEPAFITSLDQLSNSKVYTITSLRRGALTGYNNSGKIYQTNGLNDSNVAFTSASGKDEDSTDPDQQWAILKSVNNNYYLYNVGQQQFFVSQDNYSSRYAIATLASDINSSDFNLVDKYSSITGGWKTDHPEIRWAVGMGDNFFGITNWQAYNWQAFQNNNDLAKNHDEGMYFSIEPVGDFSSTLLANAMAKIEAFEAPVGPDASLEMLETPGTYYVYIKDGGKYLHNTDHGAVTATESAERAQNEIERSNAYIWRLVSDGENVTITNGIGNGYNSATPNTMAIDDIPATWHLDNMVESRIWNVEVRYCDNGDGYMTINNSTAIAYDGGFFVTSTSTESLSCTGGHVDGYNFSDVDCDRDHSLLLIRYYTPEEEEDNPYLCGQLLDALEHMLMGDVGYPLLDPEDPIFLEIYEELIGLSQGVLPDPSVYRETKAHFNELANYNTSATVMPENGDAFRLSVRSNDGRKHYYLKNDGSVTDNASEASVFVMGSTSSTEGFGALFASNDNTASKYLQSNGATGAAYAEDKCDFNLKLMVTENDASRISTEDYRRFGTFGLQANKNAADANPLFADKATITLNENDLTWQTSSCTDPLMKEANSSAIELESVDYPYTKPNLVSGTGDGHEGVFASVWLPFPMNIPDGIEVYKGTQERDVKGEPYLGLTQVSADENQCYAAGGYILYSSTVAAGQTLVLPANSVPTDARVDEDAAFAGSTEDPENYKGAINPETWEENTTGDIALWTAFLNDHADSTPYVLSNKSKGMGFYKYTGNSFPKGKAIWLKPADSSDAECVQLSFDDIISAIEALHGHTEGVEIFDLQGRRLDKVQKGQVNVINGQKIMFK